MQRFPCPSCGKVAEISAIPCSSCGQKLNLPSAPRGVSFVGLGAAIVLAAAIGVAGTVAVTRLQTPPTPSKDGDNGKQTMVTAADDTPLLTGRFAESNCVRCHHEVTDLVRSAGRRDSAALLAAHRRITPAVQTVDELEAPKLLRGYELVRENGCFGCHDITGIKGGHSVGPDLRVEPTPTPEWLTAAARANLDSPGTYRKVGPSLRRLAEKTNSSWTRKWIASPSAFREDTKMPHFYGLSTNRDDVLPEDQKGFPAAEIHAIAFYLFTESKAFLKANDSARQVLLRKQAELHKKLTTSSLSDTETKELDAATRGWIDIALLSMPARSAEINAAGADVKRLENRLNELHRARAELETRKKAKNSDDEAERIQKALEELPKEIAAAATQLAARMNAMHDLGRPVPIADKLFAADGSEASATVLDKPGDLVHGRKVFTEKGCLACHVHSGTENQGKLSVAGEATFGPNLSRIAAKLSPELGANGRRWLYQWILNPNIHHPRTRMPVTRLTEDEARDVADWLLSEKGADFKEPDPPAPDAKTLRRLTDVYLAKVLGSSDREAFHKTATDDSLKWYVGKQAIIRLGCYGCHDIPGFELDRPMGIDLADWGRRPTKDMAFEESASFVRAHFELVPDRLTKKDVAALLRKTDREGRFKELKAKWEKDEGSVTDEEKWEWLDLTSPDPADPDNLKSRPLRMPMTDAEKTAVPKLRDRLEHGPFWEIGKDGKLPFEQFYLDSLENKGREGFLYQKLADPRSFDHNRVRAWDERMRMPQHHFARIRRHKDESDREFAARQAKEEAAAREAVMTFILGLTAEAKGMHRLTADRLAEARGIQVLEKFNCVGCHQVRSGVFEFRLTDDERRRLTEAAEKSARNYVDKYAFPGHNAWAGFAPATPDHLIAVGNYNPSYNPTKPPDEFPVRNGHPVDDLGNYDIRLSEALRFADSTGLTHDLPAGETARIAPADILRHNEPYGGRFVELMLPYLIRTGGAGFQPHDGRDLLPPPLNREGERVQPGWLYQFLLNPRTIRPAVILNMPRFNMSPDEATALVDYFNAVDRLSNPAAGAGSPHLAIAQRDAAFWQGKTRAYFPALAKNKTQLDDRLKKLSPLWKMVLEEDAQGADRRQVRAEEALKQAPTDETLKAAAETAKKDAETAHKRMKDNDTGRLTQQYRERDAYAADSYRLLISVAGRACLSCHQIQGVGGIKAPPLDLAAERLRPEWTRLWISNPPAMFAYNPAMPLNVPNKPEGREDFQDLFFGSSSAQIAALRDVLMDLARVSTLPANRYYQMRPNEGK